MKRALVRLIGLVLLVSACGVAAPAASEGVAVSGETVRQTLIAGNKRYIDAKMSHPGQTALRRNELVNGQNPVAAIVCCSDSRVPPEIIFDQGLGDLFVIRLAGNIMDDIAVGSLEYSVEHLGVKYIMVLGHEKCGAVEAAIKGGEAHGQIRSLVKAIQPAVEKVRTRPGDLLDNAVRANVAMVVEKLKSSGPILEKLVKDGTLTIEGARYDLDDGSVTILH